MTLVKNLCFILLCALALTSLAGCGLASPSPAATQTPPIPTATVAPPTATPQPPTATAGAIPPTATGGAPQPSATSAPQVNNPPANDAQDKYQYLGQSIPDHTQFLPNVAETITWTIKNTGTTGWTTAYMMRYFSGPKADQDVYTFTKDVPVDQTINLIVTFTTPSDSGTYDMWFKLTNSQGQNFGDLDLVYTVSSSPSKGTSTPSQ